MLRIGFIIGCLIATSPVLGAVTQVPLAASSGADRPGRLTRVPADVCGIDAISRYDDPRAWTERLKPATVGTVGTGIGAGDFDGDGFPDLFVALREGRNRLYLNREGRRFDDATEAGGILDSPDWTTGVTVVDINGDALPDIYVCFFESPNRIYINQGGAVFEERAGALGLDVADASSGAFFADYDRDGDLDLYLQTNTGSEGGGRADRLMRNDGAAGFTDVTAAAGIRTGDAGRTLGHSVLWVDWDGDGWEDLYVANDFASPDFLYLNQHDGTFRQAGERIPVAPYSSMGSDLGDVNGDGLLDLLTTDMATPSYRKHVVSMLTSGTKTRDLAPGTLPPQVMKNALLLNRGAGDYIDVGYAWNLAATDWTWAPRLVDLDNDGRQDALFTNGMIRQFHNADLALEQDRQMTPESRTAVFRRSPVLEEANRVFRNVGGRGFEPADEDWGFSDVGVSFGVVLFDYDRDGDMDLVYTNYRAAPALWRNDLGRGNAVQIKLEGAGMNSDAIGAEAVAWIGWRREARKILANRGYLGSDEKLLHFGLGGHTSIDRLEIRWPDGVVQRLSDLVSGRRYTVRYPGSSGKPVDPPSPSPRFRLIGQVAAETAPPPARRAVRSLLYPFKPIPGKPDPRLVRADFNGDGRLDNVLLREWTAPRLILSGPGGMDDASAAWGLDQLTGLWSSVLVGDFNGDNLPDLFLGNLGLNQEISYRGVGEGRLVRHFGRFREDGPPTNVTGYDWHGTLRLFDGLRDFGEIEGTIHSRIRSFRETADLTDEAFIDRIGFSVEETFTVECFASGILLNREAAGFDFVPLPGTGQYGRVWDAVASDLDDDGNGDLVLLLGQVTPHYRSRQDEGSFVVVLRGNGDGTFEADGRHPFERKPEGRVVNLDLMEDAEGRRLQLVAEDGTRWVYQWVE